jgi:hypothetical protein
MNICNGCLQFELMMDIDPCEFVKANEISSCPCITCLVKPMCQEFCNIMEL